MLKTILKLMLCIIVYTIIFMAAGAVVPYSQSFKEMGSSDNPFLFLFMFFSCACVCFTMYFIIKNAYSKGLKLFLYIFIVMFFIQTFMMHIETLFFGSTLYVVTKLDILLLMLSGLLPFLATIPLLLKFFQIEKDSSIENKINYKFILIKLGIIGIMYLCSYILLGYLATWLFEEYKTHYGETIANTPNVYLNASIQVIRGILYGVFIIPLLNILKTKRIFIMSVCMVYLCTSIQLIIPNNIFPDKLRYIYLFEMTGAMLIFGIVVGNILWGSKKQKTSA